MKLSEKINSFNLKNMNYYAFLLHLVSAVIVAGILFSVVGEINFNTTIYGYKIDTISSNGKDVTFIFGEDGPKIPLSSESLKIIIVLLIMTAIVLFVGGNTLFWVFFSILLAFFVFYIYNFYQEKNAVVIKKK